MTKKKTPLVDIPEAEMYADYTKMVDDLYVGNNVFMVGPPGTTKTTLAKKLAYSVRGRRPNDGGEVPFIVVNANQWTSPAEILGGQTVNGFKEGKLIKAWREGLTLIIDESAKLDPNTSGVFNEALAQAAEEVAVIYDPQGIAYPKHAQFSVIATSNTLGKGNSALFVGNKKQDASFLDRFSGCVYFIGYNETLEREVIYSEVVELCLKIREQILDGDTEDPEGLEEREDIMTLRTMLNIQRAYELEMIRVLELSEDPWLSRRPDKGKSASDAFLSYFRTMGDRKRAKEIQGNVDFAEWQNSYRSSANLKSFQAEYAKRQAG